MKRAIIITSFGGDRSERVRGLVANLANRISSLPDLVLLTDQPAFYQNIEGVAIVEVGTGWTGHKRYGVRNSNFYKAPKVRGVECDSYCCLDDDMRVVDGEAFMQGFVLAEKFGICLPINPRLYVKWNARGEDVPEDVRALVDCYGYMTACNMSPLFFTYRNVKARALLRGYRDILTGPRCCRGTLAMSIASWETGVTPHYLPEQWCVDRDNAEFWKHYSFRYRGKKYPVGPICLHWGQPEVRKVFADVITE